MDMGDFKEDGSTNRRRSTRQTSKTAPYSADLKPRAPLKRTRKMREDDGESTAVNGSNESKTLAKGDDGASPDKILKLEKAKNAGVVNESGDGPGRDEHADVEMEGDEDQDQEMNSDDEAEQDHGPGSQAPSGTNKKESARRQEDNSTSNDLLPSRRSSIHQKMADAEIPQQIENYRAKTSQADSSYLAAAKLENQQESLRKRTRSNIAYQNRTTNKAVDLPPFGNRNTRPPSHSQKIGYPTIIHPATNQIRHHKHTEMKTLQKPVTSKPIPKVSSSKGWAGYMFKFLQWSLILTALLVLVILVYQKFLFRDLPQTHMVLPETLDKFDQDVAALQVLFPNQRSVFWKRSRAHLKHHLEMVNPTEPVSIILTAGLQADKTLGCLAQSLAKVYSTSRNASILEINGAAKRAQDSDQVKLEIDEALKKAFEGDKCAAVMHRFEELPPGSTLIFYRYCDHENAAFKKVFLVFTVMLSVDEINPMTSLSAVEDMVYDHLKEKFISSEKSAKFNQMDVDKMSGLWSRISHLILPVTAEDKIEQQGCGL